MHVVQVEARDDRVVFIHEHMTEADPGLLLRKERAKQCREVLEECVTTIADRLREVRTVRLLELENCSLVIEAKTLQLEHLSTLPRQRSHGRGADGVRCGARNWDWRTTRCRNSWTFTRT